jgi:hypothetical protein
VIFEDSLTLDVAIPIQCKNIGKKFEQFHTDSSNLDNNLNKSINFIFVETGRQADKDTV